MPAMRSCLPTVGSRVHLAGAPRPHQHTSHMLAVALQQLCVFRRSSRLVGKLVMRVKLLKLGGIASYMRYRGICQRRFLLARLRSIFQGDRWTSYAPPYPPRAAGRPLIRRAAGIRTLLCCPHSTAGRLLHTRRALAVLPGAAACSLRTL
jgi:hypothetical protein